MLPGYTTSAADQSLFFQTLPSVINNEPIKMLFASCALKSTPFYVDGCLYAVDLLSTLAVGRVFLAVHFLLYKI